VQRQSIQVPLLFDVYRMTNKKKLFIALVVLLLLAQYHLWFSQNGLLDMWRLRHQYKSIQANNVQLEKRNQHLMRVVNNIKHNQQVLGLQARRDLGMVDSDEEFYQIVTVPTDNQKKAQEENNDEDLGQ